MSSLAISPLTQAQAPIGPRAHWITPEKQLKRFYLPIAEEISCLSPLILDVAELVAQYVVDEWVTNWYTAQERLNSLPEKIPPLPENIYQIMNDACPIYAGQLKADKTVYKIKDTHFLSLVPKKFGSLNRFEEEILKPYGKRKYSKEKNPLQFQYFCHKLREEHADVPFPDTHWILMTKEVLPGSKNNTWEQQVALVNALSQKTWVGYEIPTLQQSFAGITTDMVVTGERLYSTHDAQNKAVYVFTRVKESTQGYQLIVGGFSPSGVHITYRDNDKDEFLGVAVLRKFEGLVSE